MSPLKPGSKYHGLHQHLAQHRQDQVSLTFAEIERLIGGRLPPSARRGRAFWSNRSRGALQAQAWMAAGYLVREVDLEAGRVTFARARPKYTVRRERGDVVWDGELIRALRAHLGVNQAGLAEILGVRQQTVSEWETGAYTPTRSRAKHLTLVAERAAFPLEPSKEADSSTTRPPRRQP